MCVLTNYLIVRRWVKTSESRNTWRRRDEIDELHFLDAVGDQLSVDDFYRNLVEKELASAVEFKKEIVEKNEKIAAAMLEAYGGSTNE